MITYLDSSVVLDRVLDAPGAEATWSRIGGTFTSVLTEVECLRGLDRIRHARLLDDSRMVRGREALFRILETAELVGIGRSVLDRAALPFPVPIKTLDALHLATASIYREATGAVNFATHDRALARAARAMGFEVLGAA